MIFLFQPRRIVARSAMFTHMTASEARVDPGIHSKRPENCDERSSQRHQ